MKNLLFRSSMGEICSEQTLDRMRFAESDHSESEIYSRFNTTESGLTAENAAAAREECGPNTVTAGKSISTADRLARAFINPFTAVLRTRRNLCLHGRNLGPRSGKKLPDSDHYRDYGSDVRHSAFFRRKRKAAERHRSSPT